MRSGKLIINLVVVALLAMLVWLNACTSIFSPRNTFIQNKQKVNLIGNTVNLNLNLNKDSYLLRIHYVSKPGQYEVIYFNGAELVSSVKSRGTQKINYLILPKQLVKQGQNALIVNFLKEPPSSVVVKIQNYYFKFFDSGYVLFPDSVDSFDREVVFNLGQYKVVITRIFFSQLFFLLFILFLFFSFARKMIKKSLKINSNLEDNPYKSYKIEYIGKIILVGFLVSIIYHLITSICLGFHYPHYTFLFSPGGRFDDLLLQCRLAKLPNFFQINNYYPVANIFLYIFSFLPKLESLMLYLGLFLAGFFYINASNLKMKDKGKYLKNVFIFFCLTYPLLFAVDRANIEIFMFIFLYLFIYFYVKKRFFLSTIFLFLAIGMKGYPAVFLVLLLSDKRYKEIIFMFLLIMISVLAFQKMGIFNWNSMISGFNTDVYSFTMNNNLVQRGVSLYSLVKLAFIQFNVINSVDMAKFLSVYLKTVFCFFVVLAGYIIFFEKEFWKKVALLIFAMLLLPHMSADYKLLHIFIPLFLFINTQKKDRFDTFYIIMFGLLLIPKDYYIFPKIISDSGTSDISIAIVLNILIMLAMTFMIVFDRLVLQKIKTKLTTGGKL